MFLASNALCGCVSSSAERNSSQSSFNSKQIDVNPQRFVDLDIGVRCNYMKINRIAEAVSENRRGTILLPIRSYSLSRNPVERYQSLLAEGFKSSPINSVPLAICKVERNAAIY